MAMDGERSRSSSPAAAAAAAAPAAMTTKPLHNFILPCGLKWGNQRFLRCMKVVNSNDEISERRRSPLSSSSPPSPSPSVAPKAVSNKSITGKRKGKDKFDDDLIPSHRRGSDCRKQGFNFKLPPLPYQRPSSSATESCRNYRSSETGEGEGDGIAAVRKKLMNDLQTAADKMKVAMLGEGLDTEEQDNSPSPSPAGTAPTVATTVTSSGTADASVRPWNLRTRRAACKEPTTTTTTTTTTGFVSCSANGGTNATAPSSIGLTSDGMNPDSTLSPLRAGTNKSPRLRSGIYATAATAIPTYRKKQRVKFSVSLTRPEIEQDFLIFANRKPARRPHKRDKYVQRQLDTLFPGLWLTEITADMYKVPESQQ